MGVICNRTVIMGCDFHITLTEFDKCIANVIQTVINIKDVN